MVKIIIFEDEPAALRRIKRLIKGIRPDYKLVGDADNIADGVALLNKTDCQLILSDIQLSDGLCFEIFEKTKSRIPVIFITAYNEYAIKTFDYNGIHYLVKPLAKEKLHKALNKFEEQKILQLNPELHSYFKKGEFVSILGPSGSGKSTLLNLLGALDVPTSGTVEIAGTDVSTISDGERAILRRKIGIVFQFFNLIGRLNARENVELPLSIANMGRSDRRQRAEELLEIVGLKDRMTHKPQELSGGERQRVAIARALAAKPDFLLMDEPTGNIDSKTAKDLMALVEDLNTTQGVSIVMVTHDRSMSKYATRTLHLLDGKIKKEVRK